MAGSKQTRGSTTLIERLRDPAQLRIVCTGVMLTIGYLGIYTPLSGKLDATQQRLTAERQRQALAREVDSLRAQASHFRNRIPADSDANEWVQYVLEGTRQFALTLKQMDSKKPQRLGPYEAVCLDLQLEGSIQELTALLHWLEANERLFRVDTAKVTPVRSDPRQRAMQLTLLGLKG